ncbi:MAG TPA: hypothetical protein PL187_03290, partial [Caldilinea sp.]|nr:hypothetical protein [Caldilinea sp.]
MRWMLVLFFVMIGVSGCQSAVEAPAPLPEPTSMPAPLLPAPLYFIEADSGQLMRMERDGATIRQVTHETARIDEFAVSPAGGALAYISDDTLIQSDAWGDNRIVKVKGESDTQEIGVDPAKLRVEAPVFSPDGSQIAFRFKGINLIERGEALQYRTVLPDTIEPFESRLMSTFVAPTPGWSPDGTKLWISMYSYGSINAGALLDLDSGEVRAPKGDMPYPPNAGAVWSSGGSFLVTPWILTKVDATTLESHLLNESWRTSPNTPLALDLVRTDDGRWLVLAMISEGDEFGIAEVRLDTGEVHWLKMLDGPHFGILAPDGSGALLKHFREPDEQIDQLYWQPLAAGEMVALL